MRAAGASSNPSPLKIPARHYVSPIAGRACRLHLRRRRRRRRRCRCLIIALLPAPHRTHLDLPLLPTDCPSITILRPRTQRHGSVKQDARRRPEHGRHGWSARCMSPSTAARVQLACLLLLNHLFWMQQLAVQKPKLMSAGHQPHRQLGNRLHLVARPPQDAAPRSRWRAHGGHGSDAGRVRG